MSLSDNLRALRKQKGYSQEQLAERLNVSRQAVSKWESDNGYPEMESLIILSDLFECTIDDLLKNDLTQHNPIRRIRALSGFIGFKGSVDGCLSQL